MTGRRSPATDNVGVGGYDIYLGDARMATGPTTRVQVAGLTCGASYGIGVSAAERRDPGVDLTTDVDFTDPTLADFGTSWRLLYATAPDGSMLVHEAAAGFP